MNEYFNILNDVVLISTFQPRMRERLPSTPRLSEFGLDRERAAFGSGRRFDLPERI